VITNQSHHHVVNNTPYNHYSLLLSLEKAFGLSCIANACETQQNGVVPMTPLFNPVG
jgi:phosphatidylinositol-3-phosphatase